MVRVLLPFLALAALALAVAPVAHAVGDVSVGVDMDADALLPAGAPPRALAVDATVTADADLAAGDASAPDSSEPTAREHEAAADEGEPLTKGVTTDVAPAAATVGGPLLWLVAQGALRALEGGALAGYARITRADVLDNKVRERVYHLLQEHPGLSPTEVQTRLELGWGTTVYHLDRLERTGLVKGERSGLSRRYFPAAAVGARERKARAALARPQLSALASHVLQAPGLLQRDLAQHAGLTRGAITKQIAVLEDAGLVTRERDGRTARVVPTPDLAALIGAEAPAGPVPPHARGEGLTAATP